MLDQSPFECRFEWGMRGAREAAARRNIVVVVDVLTFSSAAVTAVRHGARVYPHDDLAGARNLAERLGAEAAMRRADASKYGGHSLSPLSYGPGDVGKRIVLCSPNGAACVLAAAGAPAVLMGCLLNARAAAGEVDRRRRETGASATVIACGEQWSEARESERRLRPALEDYLGAGAVLSRVNGRRSPEAEVCARAFETVRPDLERLLCECGSGRELCAHGYPDDVRHSARLDVYDVVPIVDGGWCVAP